MTSLRNSIAALAVSLPLVAAAQQPPAAEPPPAAPPPPPAAAPAPAPAKPPLYSIYGTLNLNAQWTMAKAGARASTASIPSRIAVSPDSSNIGVRGAAEIARGYQVVYQCETSANLDVGGIGLCNRNSRLGVSGFWGTLFYGNWDTPYKAQAYGTKADDPFGNTDVFGYNAILSSPGFNATSGTWTGAAVGSGATATAAGFTGVRTFDLRANNSIAYWSPKFMGASLKAQWGTNELKTARGAPAAQGYLQNPNLYSAVVNYDLGPLSVHAAFERHEDGGGLVSINGGTTRRFGTTAANPGGETTAGGVQPTNTRGTEDDAWRVGAGYELPTPFGTTTISAQVEELKFKQRFVAPETPLAVAGAVREYKRMAYQGGLKHRMGSHEFRARYSYADGGECKFEGIGNCNTVGLEGQDIALGYAYHFTKAAQGFLYYTRIENARFAQYSFTLGGSSVITGNVPAGADPQAAGVGLRYAF